MHTRLKNIITARQAGLLLCLAAFMAASLGYASDRDEDILRDMRSQRREAMYDINQAPDKSESPALFGLLVIPVDFADARLPQSWDPNDLTYRLTSGSGESLRRYFDVASRGRLELRVTQVPVIHLPGTRRDYSDVGYNGFSRTRELADQSLTAVKDLGLEFRRLDMDGPDRIPGTADDDGVLDGVLILHSGIGQENDPVNGLIQALQFFLDEPVVSLGVEGTFYAVASLQSGPGIWAHETGHLLGLEDRYDPGLRPSGGSEVMSRGGLGRFSLMASGAWGTGDGYGASLPDAYSCLQLGWYDEKDLSLNIGAADTLLSGIVAGQAGRLWTKGQRGPEYFLMETRDPEAAYPFDADIPGKDLIIYHIDENLPEGQIDDDGSDWWHLRASLVEADNDFRLRRGQDSGRAEDLFPGPLGKDEFAPWTIPSSDGYTQYSGVGLVGISPVPGGVSFQATAWYEPALSFEVGFTGDDEVVMNLAARSVGLPFGTLRCIATVSSTPPWGAFTGNQMSVAFDLADDGTGTWRPLQAVPWFPDPNVPGDAQTNFTFEFQYDDGSFADIRSWYWKDNGDVLDFGSAWPGQWSISGTGNNETFWWRWDGAPFLTADETPVLACTGFEFQDSSSWPEVNYQNRATINLTSGTLGPDVTAVRLVHAIEVEHLTADVAMDGATIVWVDQQLNEISVEPRQGWPGTIAEQAVNILHGQGAFIEPDELELEDDLPVWRTDIIPVPEGLPGPWRLRLKFGSNTLWRKRGWFIASVDAVVSEPAEAAFEGIWIVSGTPGLAWNWPWPAAPETRFIIQHREGEGGAWETIVDDAFESEGGNSHYFIPSNQILPYLDGSSRQRHELRVLGFMSKGKVATRSIVVFPDGGDGETQTLSQPWPNPALGSVRFLVEIPPGGQGNLGIFDLKGAKVLGWTVYSGSHLLEWNGRDSHGARSAAGTYIIRLEGSGPAVMRKVVLLH